MIISVSSRITNYLFLRFLSTFVSLSVFYFIYRMFSTLCANCWTCNWRIYWFCNCNNMRSLVHFIIVCTFSIHDTSMKWCNEHRKSYSSGHNNADLYSVRVVMIHNVFFIFSMCKLTFSSSFPKLPSTIIQNGQQWVQACQINSQTYLCDSKVWEDEDGR